MRLYWIPGLLLAGLTLSRSARADVLIGNGPGSPYMGLAHAIAVAQEGDVVLVRVEVNEGDLSVYKGISVVADVSGRLNWRGHLSIVNVPSGSTALISGFNFGLTSSSLPASAPLKIANNAGSIRVQDCGVLPIPVMFQPAIVGVVCTTNSDVAFLRCGLVGGQAPGPPSPPGNGAYALTATDSTITIQDSDVVGANGPNGVFDYSFGGPTAGGHGANGILMSGGSLVLQTSKVHGGRGGAGYPADCVNYFPTPGGSGGIALVMTSGAVARAIGGRTLGGAGGLGGAAPCGNAANGVTPIAVDTGGGSWTRREGVGRAFVAPRIVRVGEPLPLNFAGAPGEHAFLAGGSAAGYLDTAIFDGVLLVEALFRRVEYGVLGEQGTLALALTTPGVPGGMTNDLMHLQPICLDDSGQAHVGCTQIVVRVDAAY